VALWDAVNDGWTVGVLLFWGENAAGCSTCRFRHENIYLERQKHTAPELCVYNGEVSLSQN
jgi:hypothetical protein